MGSLRKKFFKVIAALAGIRVSESGIDVPRPNLPETNDKTGAFEFYGSYSLEDGDQIVKDLEAVGMPFEVELDDGIRDADERFGSGGDSARLSIFVQKENFDLVSELIRARFHK